MLSKERKSLGGKLRDLRKSKGLTLQAMADELGVSNGFLSEVERDKKMPGGDFLLSLKRVYGVSLDAMFDQNYDSIEVDYVGTPIKNAVGPPEVKTPEELEYGGARYLKVPRYSVLASAGGGAVVESEQIVDYLSFSRDWLKTALGVGLDRLALINVIGDSMSPTYNDGDLILVDTANNKLKSDAVYVLQHDDCLWVKRLYFRFDGTVSVISDNPHYPEQTISGSALERLKIIGRVLWRGGK